MKPTLVWIWLCQIIMGMRRHAWGSYHGMHSQHADPKCGTHMHHSLGLPHHLQQNLCAGFNHDDSNHICSNLSKLSLRHGLSAYSRGQLGLPCTVLILPLAAALSLSYTACQTVPSLAAFPIDGTWPASCNNTLLSNQPSGLCTANCAYGTATVRCIDNGAGGTKWGQFTGACSSTPGRLMLLVCEMARAFSCR
jgi:hypothetical protein